MVFLILITLWYFIAIDIGLLLILLCSCYCVFLVIAIFLLIAIVYFLVAYMFMYMFYCCSSAHIYSECIYGFKCRRRQIVDPQTVDPQMFAKRKHKVGQVSQLLHYQGFSQVCKQLQASATAIEFLIALWATTCWRNQFIQTSARVFAACCARSSIEGSRLPYCRAPWSLLCRVLCRQGVVLPSLSLCLRQLAVVRKGFEKWLSNVTVTSWPQRWDKCGWSVRLGNFGSSSTDSRIVTARVDRSRSDANVSSAPLFKPQFSRYLYKLASAVFTVRPPSRLQ